MRTIDAHVAQAQAIIRFKRDAERNSLALMHAVLGQVIEAIKTGDTAMLEQSHAEMEEILGRD